MNHEEFLANGLEPIDWAKRNPVDLVTNIRVSGRIMDYYHGNIVRCILEVVRDITTEHTAPIDKHEVIPWENDFDDNFKSVLFQWTSDLGVFRRVYVPKYVKSRLSKFVPQETQPDWSKFLASQESSE